MIRAVVDPNVLIAAALAPNGPPADCLRAHADGRFELIVSELLLAELNVVPSATISVATSRSHRPKGWWRRCVAMGSSASIRATHLRSHRQTRRTTTCSHSRTSNPRMRLSP